MQTVECLACFYDIEVEDEDDISEDDILECPECRTQFEITNADPLEIEECD